MGVTEYSTEIAHEPEDGEVVYIPPHHPQEDRIFEAIQSGNPTEPSLFLSPPVLYLVYIPNTTKDDMAGKNARSIENKRLNHKAVTRFSLYH